MEIISAIGLAISPFIVMGITNLVKKVESINVADNRVFLLRFVVAILSFITVVVSAWFNHTKVDPSIIQTFSETVVVFIGATGMYFWNKYKV